MEKYKRIFVIVLDSLGIGEIRDAARFGDHDVDTFGHICDTVGTLNISNLKKLGLLNLHPTKEMEEERHPIAYYTRLKETSNGKDTMTGHWEMMGLKIEKPFLTFTDTGFPPELIHELEERCGKKVIGNKCASGTQILDELGEEEIKNGSMIVYTSADSVMQICGNEETFDLKNLYRCCEIARELTMKNEWKVGRIIARPYVEKKKGEFVRTSNRRDYALKPFSRTALNALKDEGFDVISVGKINDIFCGEGITKAYHSESSVHGMQQTVATASEADAAAFRAAHPGLREIDCRGKLVMPGLVNTHCHAAMTLQRSYADDISLMAWLHDYIWPFEAHQTPDDVKLGMTLGQLFL